MTNDSTKIHVPIDAVDNIDSVSKGKVSKPMWTAYDGYAREKAIHEARLQAMEEHAVQKAEQNAVFDTQRFLLMEGAIADLQKKVKELTDAQK